jgi:hypothetical protein
MTTLEFQADTILEESERAPDAGVDEAEGVVPDLGDRIAMVTQIADCLTEAESCEDQARCGRGEGVAPWLKVDGGTIPPNFDFGQALPKPWEKPWDGTGTNHVWKGPPWGGEVALIAGVDSVACAQCAIQRCPTMAYFCFGAADSTVDCPGGDCCQSLRACTEECGGYRPQATPAEFQSCVNGCAVSRPHALQQLWNLQDCGEIACAGCETHDRQSVSTEDGGIDPVILSPPATSSALHPMLNCVQRFGPKDYVAIFGYSNDAATTVTVPIGPDNIFVSAPTDRQQPIQFLPGLNTNAFSVSFDGKKISWKLNGETVTAHPGSPKCAPKKTDGGDDDDDDKDKN